ncbi:MAG TPA: hypothetical protein VER03_19405 [Bryobacteraceae bacterium]|nr:hypothetical protein [Bryobacteraceae bacterium]
MKRIVLAAVVIAYIANLSLVLAQRGVVDYDTQIKNKPGFRSGFWYDGRDYHVDPYLTDHVRPTEPDIRPGRCRIGTDSVMASWTRVRTPSYEYICIPDGQGGFRWGRSKLETTW